MAEYKKEIEASIKEEGLARWRRARGRRSVLEQATGILSRFGSVI